MSNATTPIEELEVSIVGGSYHGSPLTLQTLGAALNQMPSYVKLETNVEKRRYYQHYRGDVYELVMGALDEDTQTPLRVYKCVKTDMVYVMPAAKFYGMITIADSKIPEQCTRVKRFTLLDSKPK